MVLFWVVAVLTLSVAVCFNAKAEMYVAGQVGYAIPNDLSDVSGTGKFSGDSFSPLALKSSLAYGAKVGHFWSNISWLGLEFETYTTRPNQKQQSVGISRPAGNVNVVVPGMNTRVTTVALNLIARYPGKIFQPYAGVGVGGFFARDERQPGLNGLAGVRVMLTDQAGLFGEYKYNRATFEFTETIPSLGTGGLKGNYSANIIVVGISYHF
jgi:opacity protein-like surface antigen